MKIKQQIKIRSKVSAPPTKVFKDRRREASKNACRKSRFMKTRRGIATLGVIVMTTIILGTVAVLVPTVDNLVFDGELMGQITQKETPTKD